MDSPRSPKLEIDHDAPSPFLLKVYFKTGSFHRPDEFTSPHHLRHVPIYTHPTCTLTEITHHLAAASLDHLPALTIGTRVGYRLIYPDTRSRGPPRFAVKELGSVVVGAEGSGSSEGFGDADADDDAAALAAVSNVRDSTRRLEHSGFVTGDVISAAILPPLASGAVASAPELRVPPGPGPGPGRFGMRENGFGIRGGGMRGGPRGGFGGGFERGPSVPTGDWRRGERLPDQGPRRGRGRDRW